MIRVEFYRRAVPPTGSRVNPVEVQTNDFLTNIELHLQMEGSSSASFQLPRFYGTLLITYDNSSRAGELLSWYFDTDTDYRAKKGDYIYIYDFNSASSTVIDESLIMRLDSWSVDKDNKQIKVTMTSSPIDAEQIVRYGGRLLPTDLSEDTLKSLGLQNVYRFTYPVSNIRNLICASNSDEMLLALAWAYDNKRHNLSFTPAKGVSAPRGSTLLIPSPNQPADGIPRYSIEPEDIIDYETLEPELTVTDLMTGALSTDVLVPIVTPIATNLPVQETLQTGFKTFTCDGKLIAYAVLLPGTRGYIMCEGKTLIYSGNYMYAYSVFAVTKGKYRKFQDGAYRYIDAYYLLDSSSAKAYSLEGEYLGSTSYEGDGALSHTTDDLKAMISFKEITVPPYWIQSRNYQTASMISAPRDGYVYKAAGYDGVPMFKSIRSYRYHQTAVTTRAKGSFTWTQQEGWIGEDPKYVTYVSMLQVPFDPDSEQEAPNNSLADAFILMEDTYNSEPAVPYIIPLTGATLPTQAVQDWSQVQYLDCGKTASSSPLSRTAPFYVLYTVPSVITGMRLLCIQQFGATGSATTLHVLQVDQDFIGAYIYEWGKPMYVVSRNAYYKFDLSTTSGTWFKLLSAVEGPGWGQLDEMYMASLGHFVISKTVASEATNTTRTTYIMEGESPFELSGLAPERVQTRLNAAITYNPREVPYVIDPANLEGVNKVPKVGKKYSIRIAKFRYKINAADEWTEADVRTLSMPMLGGLCRVKLRPDADTYAVGIISAIHFTCDGLERETVEINCIVDPPSIV